MVGISQNTTIDDNEDPTPPWVHMVNDNDANFYDIQKAAVEYYNTHSQGKGSGWKQFKRWEYFMEQRVFPTGNRIPQSQVWTEIGKFNEKYGNNNNRSNRSTWVPLGPSTSANVTGHWNPGLGRINVIALDPNDSDIIYIGAPSGGLWKTEDEGENWTPMTDNLPVLGVSAIVIDLSNTDIIYIGTGDKDANDNYSIGVLKSTDGGNTWNPTGLEWTEDQNRTIAKLLINPNDPKILFAGTTDGLYKTTDAGDNWVKTQGGDIDDMEFKPGDPNTVYAITKKFYKSTDGGDSFTETTGVPTSSRAQIAVSDANPDYVYFFSSATGIYRSMDSGDSFTKRSSQPNQGSQSWYDLAFCVSHTDADEVHLGEINTWKSTNGGTTWIKTTDWTWNNPIGYTHCDIHEMVFYGNTLYVGSDGLISKSTDGASTWTNLSEGLSIRQFYRIGTSKNDPYKIMGGSQDNGTSVYTTDHWHEWLGADGMECVVDYTNSNTVYGTSQNGIFYKSNTGGNNGGMNIDQPGGGNWVTPFVIHPTENQTLYVGGSEVKKTINGMMSWTTVSSLGIGNLDQLAIAESDGNYLYTSNNERIYRTIDGGENWENISGGLPNLNITYIAIHPENPERIAVSLSGFEDGEKVYTSEDGGDSWTNYSINLPNIPANCVVYAIGDANSLYVGMDVGIYYIDNEETEWSSFYDGLPNVIVNELEINHDAQLIRAGTYGRGLWETELVMYPPVADFEADQTMVIPDCSVNFTSLSQGPPEDYEWIFEGATPGSSSEKNPENITYNTPGTYDVQLIVVNSLGSDTLTKEDYITVSNTLLPAANFTSPDSASCSNSEVHLFDETLYCPSAWEWSFEPSTVTFVSGTDANSQNPIVELDPGIYTVTLTSSNTIGSNTITKTDYLSSGGYILPFFESFEFDNLKENGWEIDNPDGDITWGMKEVLGSSPGNNAAYMNLIDYPGFGQRDRLISPALNFTGMSNLQLQFDYAYAQRYFLMDSLIVLLSDDCGDTWTRIYANGPDATGIFATSPTTEEPFEPQSSEDWCGEGYGAECVLLDLAQWEGSSNIKIMFESYCQFGNNLYIDNVLVSNNVGIENISNSDENIEIAPNPSNGKFDIYLNSMIGDIAIRVINPKGQTVYTDNITVTNSVYSKQINLDDNSAGIYIIEIISRNGLETKKVVIK